MMIHLANPESQSTLSEYVESQIQPNAIDLVVDNIYSMEGSFSISETEKQHRATHEVPLAESGWVLEIGSYEIVMKGTIELGPDEAGVVITRSSLNRNGVFITSGLYDSGYKGVMAGCLHVLGGSTKIERGTRVAQFLLFKAESLHQYDGSYGVGSDHDKKYNT